MYTENVNSRPHGNVHPSQKQEGTNDPQGRKHGAEFRALPTTARVPRNATEMFLRAQRFQGINFQILGLRANSFLNRMCVRKCLPSGTLCPFPLPQLPFSSPTGKRSAGRSLAPWHPVPSCSGTGKRRAPKKPQLLIYFALTGTLSSGKDSSPK